MAATSEQRRAAGGRRHRGRQLRRARHEEGRVIVVNVVTRPAPRSEDMRAVVEAQAAASVPPRLFVLECRHEAMLRAMKLTSQHIADLRRAWKAH